MVGQKTQRAGRKTVKIAGEVKMVEFVQQTRLVDTKSMEDIIKGKCAKGPIEKWAYIIHDKDTNDEGELVKEHVHCLMKFKYSVRLSAIASWFKCEGHNLQKLKRKWITACRYLTHMNHPNKYQYPNSDVVANFNYVDECEIKDENAQMLSNISKAVKAKKLSNAIVKKLNKIASGEITAETIADFFTPREFDLYNSHINNYLKYAKQKRILEQERRKNETKSENLYMYGESGVGKTYYAKRYSQDKYRDCFVTGTSNDPLDGYEGQEVIIFDDIRPEDMSLSEYIKLADPHTSSNFRSRFKNKRNIARCLIMTTPHSPNTFVKRLKKGNVEEDKQFYRRHDAYVRVFPNVIQCYTYDEDTNSIKPRGQRINRLKQTLQTHKKNPYKTADTFLEFIDKVNVERDVSTSAGSQELFEFESEVTQYCEHMETPRAQDESEIHDILVDTN